MRAFLFLLITAVTAAACTSGPESTAEREIQRGFAVPAYSQAGYETAEIPDYLRQILDVGGDWVQVNPTWYQEHTESTVVKPAEKTVSDSGVERLISTAHQMGLKVLLKPHVDLLDDSSRHGIDPVDRAAWFDSYKTFVRHYAQIAQKMKVDQFAIGTELVKLSAERAHWLDIVAEARAQYSGTLLYAANFDEYRSVRFWDALDLVGIDAYWKLADVPTTDPNTLQQAWLPIRDDLQQFSAVVGRSILFTEAGYTSQFGATTEPSSPIISNRPDQREQAAAYESLLSTFNNAPWWAGVFWWYWAVPLDQSGDEAINYSPHTKAAEEVVRRWWKSGRSHSS